ncbi:hypothetical protein OAJ57_04960 [Alphaproteobacteria bacterium]|nr:hypothetical protein [Alphaproteobacteria bacterium]
MTAKLAGLGGVAGLIAVSVYVMVNHPEQENGPPPSLSNSFGPPAPLFPKSPTTSFSTPPDLSRMTQREAADRLFNRIMSASEKGNKAEALGFVPMAVEAYGSLPALDRDAHYHLGLIHGVAGDSSEGKRHIAALRKGAPNHLLALILEHDIAVQSGDRAAVSRIISMFDVAYNMEIAVGRPEYQAHRNTIERFRAVR